MKEKVKTIVHWLGHASFRLEGSKSGNIYIDPYQLKGEPKKAAAILITHDHFDHFSKEDILKIAGENTIIFGPAQIKGKTDLKFEEMKPGDKKVFGDIEIEAVSSYNTNKKFHPKEAGNLGYIIDIDGIRIYHAGDTDIIDEMKNIKTDIALLPIGGTYTMNIEDAVKAVKDIRPSIAVPMHYGSVVGLMTDGDSFKKSCPFCDIEVLPIEK